MRVSRNFPNRRTEPKSRHGGIKEFATAATPRVSSGSARGFGWAANLLRERKLPRSEANLHTFQQQPGMVDRFLRFGIGRGALFVERCVRPDECGSHEKFPNRLFAATHLTFSERQKVAATASPLPYITRAIPDTKLSSSVT